MCTFYDKQINAKKYEWKFGSVQVLLVGDCILERQNVKLVLKVIHESTVAALAVQNDLRCPELQTDTSDFIQIRLSLWKIFNVNIPYKHVRLNDAFSSPFVVNDERFSLLRRVVYWLEAWESLPGKEGKLSLQTFTSFRHACVALPK